jgi:hypothetical protein
LNFLECKSIFVSDLHALIEILPLTDPQVFLVSVNLSNVDATHLISVLNTAGYPCIAFGEEEGPETFLKLLKGDSSRTILPPISVDAVMERLELTLPKFKQFLGAVRMSTPERPYDWSGFIKLLKEKKLLRPGKVETREDSSSSRGLGKVESDYDNVAETELRPKAVLLYDIFIRMPLNNKNILYLRKGCTISDENLARLRSFGLGRVFRKR